MLFTSYFGNHRNFPKHKRRVSIARSSPNGSFDEIRIDLAPTETLLRDFKDGKIDEAEYRFRYVKEVLDNLDPAEIEASLSNSILLCYEKTGEFCHRHILSEWLSFHGVNIEELPSHVKIAVVGSRGFSDNKYFFMLLDRLISHYPSVEFVSGGAVGADLLCRDYAGINNLKITEFLPDWEKYGKSAGYRRNKEIIDFCDICIAFWDGKSKGTKHSIGLAKKAGKKCYIVNYLSKKIDVVFADKAGVVQNQADAEKHLFS